MSRIIASSLLAACMLLGGSLINPYQVTAAEKPLLSIAIKKAIDTKGVVEAKKQYTKEYAADKNRYQINIPDKQALARGYAQERNIQATYAVMEIANPYMTHAATVTRNAKAKKNAKLSSDIIKKAKADAKVRSKELIAAQKKAMADYKSAHAKRIAQYEAQRKPVFFKPGALPIKPTLEDSWYIVQTLNVDAKGVSIMSFTMKDLHEAAIAAGFKGKKSGSGGGYYTKGPIGLSVYFDPARNFIKKLRYQLRDLSSSQWDAYAKNIMHQLGRAGPSCIRRKRSNARLNCNFAGNYASVEITGKLVQDKGRLELRFHR